MQFIDAEEEAAYLGLIQSTPIFKLVIRGADGRDTLASSWREDGGQLLHVGDGTRFTVDGSSLIQRTASISLSDHDGSLVARDAEDLVHPVAGNEVYAYAGFRLTTFDPVTTHPIRLDDGTLGFEDHWFPCGVFGIIDYRIRRSEDGLSIDLGCKDRAARLQANSWGKPVFQARQNYATLLDFIIRSRYPTAPSGEWAPDTELMPKVFFGIDTRNDPLADCGAIARRAGMRFGFDGRGVPVTRPVPNDDEERVVWTFASDQVVRRRANLTEVERRLDIDELRNAFMLDVQTPEDPEGGSQSFQVLAADDRDESPTRRDGRLGQRLKRDRASKPMTVARAQLLADAHLREIASTVEDVTFKGRVIHVLDALDLIGIRDTATGVVDAHTLERFDWSPFEPSMNGATRSRRVSRFDAGDA